MLPPDLTQALPRMAVSIHKVLPSGNEAFLKKNYIDFSQNQNIHIEQEAAHNCCGFMSTVNIQ